MTGWLAQQVGVRIWNCPSSLQAQSKTARGKDEEIGQKARWFNISGSLEAQIPAVCIYLFDCFLGPFFTGPQVLSRVVHEGLNFDNACQQHIL